MLREGASMNDIMVRRAVIHGLSRIEQPWAIELLQKMQVEDEQWVVRNLATQYIEQGSKPDPRVPQKLPIPSETPWLIEFAGKQGMGIPRGGSAADVLATAFGGDASISFPFGASNNLGYYEYGTQYGMNGIDHTGIDIPQPYGSPIYAPVDAQVVCVGCWRNGEDDAPHHLEVSNRVQWP